MCHWVPFTRNPLSHTQTQTHTRTHTLECMKTTLKRYIYTQLASSSSSMKKKRFGQRVRRVA